jgi:hypothetical protein
MINYNYIWYVIFNIIRFRLFNWMVWTIEVLYQVSFEDYLRLDWKGWEWIRSLLMPRYYVDRIAEIPGVARDSIRNEGTREINYGSCISASRPGRFTPREIVSYTHWIGGWVGPRTGLDVVEKRNILAPAGNPTLAIQPVARWHTTDRSDKNGVYPTLQLLFTLILSLIASFMRACS